MERCACESRQTEASIFVTNGFVAKSETAIVNTNTHVTQIGHKTLGCKTQTAHHGSKRTHISILNVSR